MVAMPTDDPALVLRPQAEAGKGGAGAELHLAGLADLAQGPYLRVGAPPLPVGAAAHHPLKGGGIPLLCQLDSLHGS